MKEAAILIFISILGHTQSRDFAYNGRMGPDHWGEQYNSCGGKHQSPIDINDLEVVDQPFWPISMLQFNETPTRGVIVNNGHTVVVKLEFDGSKPIIFGGPLEDKGTFQFAQLHFHWGENNTVGSEDRINSVSFPAELHMVFRNTKYANFDEAVQKNDGVAVLAFFYEIEDEDNSNYAEFIELLENVQDPDTSATFKNPPKLQDLIVHDYENYYSYSGSLTTPPCSEDVTWIDFITPIKISQKQIERFRHLYTYDGIPLTHNFRPIQPLNNRTIYKAVSRNSGDAPPDLSIPLVDIGNQAAATILCNSFIGYIAVSIWSLFAFVGNHFML